MFGSCASCRQGDACAAPHTPFRNHGLKVIDSSYHALSKEEQERIHRDLYGVEEAIDETPGYLDSKLVELDKALSALNNATKKAYILATKGFPREKYHHHDRHDDNNCCGVENNYVSSRKFRLMFLRAERFDAEKAALRYTRYLAEKRDLFGDDVLPRRITEDDLYRKTDKEALASGFCCVTGETDTSGRLVAFFRRKAFFGLDVESMLRVEFYLFQLALENNEEVQKKGLVLCAFNVGVQQVQWTSRFRNYMPVFRHSAHALPIRMAAVHMVYNDIKEHILLNLTVVVFPNKTRSRHHCHYVNSYQECLFLLLSLGIDPAALPFAEDGTFRKEIMCEYLAQKRDEGHISCRLCDCHDSEDETLDVTRSESESEPLKQ